jgi:hypothetical protein
MSAPKVTAGCVPMIKVCSIRSTGRTC